MLRLLQVHKVTIKSLYYSYLRHLGRVFNLCILFLLDLNHSYQWNTLLSAGGEIFQLTYGAFVDASYVVEMSQFCILSLCYLNSVTIRLYSLVWRNLKSESTVPQFATLVRIQAPSSTLFSQIYSLTDSIWVWNLQICSDLSHFGLLCFVCILNSTVFSFIYPFLD